MEQWKEYRLCDLLSHFKSGKSIKSDKIDESGDYPVYGGNGLRGFTDTKNFVGDCASIGRQGAFCGNVRYFAGSAYMTEHAIIAVANKENNTRFLSYILGMMQLGRFSGQSAQPGLSVTELSKILIKVPSLPVQNKISSILSSLDDKIELNRQINDNLEQQAQALFKSWFVDNINTNWAEKQLNDICLQITDGVHNSVNDTNNGGYYLLSCKNIKNGQLLISDNEREIDSITFSKLRKRTKLDKGDILLTSVGTIGEMCMLMSEPINIEFQRSVAILKPNTDLISSYFLYELLLNQQSQIKHLAHGAVQQCIFISDLKGFNITVPDKESILKFDNIVSPIFRKKAKLCDEIKSLSQLRDTLLPRLMSGELKINEINC